MQLHHDVRGLAGDTADNAAVFDEESEDVQTPEEPVPASFMAAEDGVSDGGPVCLRPSGDVKPMNVEELSRLLAEQNRTSTDAVVVDCRPYLAYSASHIVDAHNVCYPSLLERRRSRRQAGSGNRVPTIPLKNVIRCDEVRQAVTDDRCRCIVVYDDDTNSVQWPDDVSLLSESRSFRSFSASQLISVLCSLAECTNCELRFLQGLLL